MSDINIHKGKVRAYIFAESIKGREWIKERMSEPRNGGDTTSVSVEIAEDLANDMRAEGISVRITS